MAKGSRQRLTRDDWVRGALEVLREHGVEGVTVAQISKRLGATSGSFYWHFKGVEDLLNSLLGYWEREFTDAIINTTTAFRGSAEDRILFLMLHVIEGNAGLYDNAILVWGGRYPSVRDLYGRAIQRRFDFVGSLFEAAGFSEAQAELRGRFLVGYLMGESAPHLKANRDWKDMIREMHRLVVNPARPVP